MKNIFIKQFFKYSNLGLLALFLFAALASFKLPSIHAQENEASNSTKEAVNIDLIKQRLQKSQVLGKKDDQKKHAVVGKIMRATSENITIETNQGETFILPLNDAILLNQKEEAIGVDKVVIDTWMTALGYIDEEDNFEPLYLIVSNQNIMPKNQIVSIGSIKKVTNKNISLTPRNNPSTSLDFSISKNTAIQDSSGEEMSVDSFEEDMQVLIVGFSEKENNTASTIRSLVPKN